jgi:hypothetical protein
VIQIINAGLEQRDQFGHGLAFFNDFSFVFTAIKLIIGEI